MTFFWLVAWLVAHRPRVRVVRSWNNWGIALGVCLALDVLSGLGNNARRQWRVQKGAHMSKAPSPVKESKTPEPVTA